MEELKQFFESDSFVTIMNVLTSAFVVIVSSWAHKLKVKLFSANSIIEDFNKKVSLIENHFENTIKNITKKFDDKVEEEQKLSKAITIFGDMFSTVFLDLKISNNSKEVIGEKARQLRELGVATVKEAVDKFIPDEKIDIIREEIQKVEKAQTESQQVAKDLADSSVSLYERISNAKNE